MVFEIEPRGDEPRIRVYENLEELRKATGHPSSHGYFDARENMIVATADSVAHEIAHFRDFRSGKMKVVSKISDPLTRTSAKLRNEIVAILFAYSKCGEGGTSLDYEIEFIKLAQFLQQKEKTFPGGRKSLAHFNFTEIQALADWISDSKTNWFGRLEFLFRSYLSEEIFTTTYSTR